eukprot:JP447189.1.p3 GENE.JP447189.1~~JP447189.1.p3  ORF type:complete len:73 (+),score=7.63 JP447189.1:421-639(+)
MYVFAELLLGAMLRRLRRRPFLKQALQFLYRAFKRPLRLSCRVPLCPSLLHICTKPSDFLRRSFTSCPSALL